MKNIEQMSSTWSFANMGMEYNCQNSLLDLLVKRYEFHNLDWLRRVGTSLFEEERLQAWKSLITWWNDRVKHKFIRIQLLI